MNVSGLVITLTSDTTARARLLHRLACDERVDVGEVLEPRLPITLEAPDLRAERTFWGALQGDPAVADVHVVYHHFGGGTQREPDLQEAHREA